MAVFVSASDESAGKNRTDQFVFLGWIARERDWSDIFAPAWQRLVLDGPPTIPYLYMTDMRSEKWRDKHGLSEKEADKRIDEAVSIVTTASFIYPIGLTVSGADIKDAFVTAQVKSKNKRSSSFEPDYLCFLGYAMMSLDFVSKVYPECEKLDFMVELNGKITEYIKDFHATLKTSLTRNNRPDLAKLVGELLPVGKDRVPVQAADVLCWHTARSNNPSAMSNDDYRRYKFRGDKGH